MNNPKHTPGPWHAVKYPDTKSWTVSARESVASKIKTESDAQLIAAAPDLLSALIECRAEITRINAAAGETIFNPAATQLLDGAVSKATGGQS